jgi:threonine dehydrogenase-like Zn-dependent dehydrogenase
MRAAVLRQGRMTIDDVPEPVPEEGQVLVQVKACGICGTDLHFASHGDEVLSVRNRMEGAPPPGGTAEIDLGADVFMGHEFSAEVLAAGPGTSAPLPGTIVTSMPALRTASGYRGILYSNDVYGGYAERMLLTANLLRPVPEGLPPTHAALTEPMAVGFHAVNLSNIELGCGAIVVGAGPVGQSVVAALAARHIEPVLAVDPSATRRRLARAMGAHDVIDPRERPMFDAWKEMGGRTRATVFDATGVPGVLDEIMRTAPRRTHIVEVGLCSGSDTITPSFGITKELSIQYAVAYSAEEFDQTLQAMAEGVIDVSPLITAEVPLTGLPRAFEDLAHPDAHCKIVMRPDL